MNVTVNGDARELPEGETVRSLVQRFSLVPEKVAIELAEVLGEYFVTSFLAYKRNEIERFERFVTDWEFREYAYHL